MIVTSFVSDKGDFGLNIGLKDGKFILTLSNSTWTTLIDSTVENLEVAIKNAKNDIGIIKKEHQFISVKFDNFTPEQFQKFLEAINIVTRLFDNTL